MGLSSNNSDQATTKEVNMYTGVIPFKLVAFNPTEEELKAIGLNFAPNDYISEDKFNEGHKQFAIALWLKNVKFIAKQNGEDVEVPEGSITTSLTFNISDEPTVSQNGKPLFVNKYGDTMYAESVDFIKQNYEWFDVEGIRPAHKGEGDLYMFLRAHANLNYSKDNKDSNCLEDPKTLFNDATFLKDYFKGLMADKPLKYFYGLQSLKNAGETDNGATKVRQVMYKQYYQKKTQGNSAVSNFKSFLNAERATKDVEDKILQREPKGEFYTIAPEIFTLDEARKKVEASVDEADKDGEPTSFTSESTF